MENARLVPKDIKPFNVKNYVKFSNDLKARDKILRLAQYYGKYLAYRLKEADPKSEYGEKVNLLSKGIGLHRKAFKIGSFIDEYQKLLELLAKNKQDANTYLNIVLRIAMGLFVVYDNLVWLINLKIVTSLDKDAIKMSAYRFRLLAAILNTVLGVMDWQKKEKAVKKAEKGTEERREAEEALGKVAVTMIKNVMDCITYGNSAELIKAVTGSSLNDGYQGAFGAVSAAAALYSIWTK